MLGCVTGEWNVGVFGSWKGDCRSGGNWEFWKEEEGLWLSLAFSIALFERWSGQARKKGVKLLVLSGGGHSSGGLNSVAVTGCEWRGPSNGTRDLLASYCRRGCRRRTG